MSYFLVCHSSKLIFACEIFFILIEIFFICSHASAKNFISGFYCQFLKILNASCFLKSFSSTCKGYLSFFLNPLKFVLPTYTYSSFCKKELFGNINFFHHNLLSINIRTYYKFSNLKI